MCVFTGDGFSPISGFKKMLLSSENPLINDKHQYKITNLWHQNTAFI